MKRIIKDMLEIYVPNSNLDWMNYRIYDPKDLTFHHIIKREDGGKEKISNGAILLREPHQYLHVIEYKALDVYISLNKIFEIVNKQNTEPTEEQREIVEYLLNKFEYEHEEELNAKGKILIKDSYKKRW